MTKTARAAGLALVISVVPACEDVRNFTRRMKAGAENSVAEPAAEVEADWLCQRVKEGTTTYAALLAEWDPSSPYGENLKTAMQSVATDQRYDALVSSTGGDWSCPELEPVLEAKE
jgi:hypothetical protein